MFGEVSSCENSDISSVGTLSPTCKKRGRNPKEKQRRKPIIYDMLGSYLKGRPKSKVVRLPGYAESCIIISDHYDSVMI